MANSRKHRGQVAQQGQGDFRMFQAVLADVVDDRPSGENLKLVVVFNPMIADGAEDGGGFRGRRVGARPSRR